MLYLSFACMCIVGLRVAVGAEPFEVSCTHTQSWLCVCDSCIHVLHVETADPVQANTCACAYLMPLQ